MEKYLIYQDKESKLHKKEIKDLEAAQNLINSGKVIKINNEPIHIVGIGTEDDFNRHRQITGEVEYDQLPHFQKLKSDIEHFKMYKEWPRE